MRDGLLAEGEALKHTIADANATIEATERLLKMAGETEYKSFCEYSASHDAPGRIPSPDAADPASAEAAHRHGRDPDAAAGVSGIITQLMLPTAAQSTNLGAAYAAALEQAHLVHEDLTGNKGPTLEPVLPAQGHDVAGGGSFAPRMAWVCLGAPDSFRRGRPCLHLEPPHSFLLAPAPGVPQFPTAVKPA